MKVGIVGSGFVGTTGFITCWERRTVSVDAVPAGWRILDIGPESVKRFTQYLRTARTVVWNGPMGVF